jgi:hypothetical protein
VRSAHTFIDRRFDRRPDPQRASPPVQTDAMAALFQALGRQFVTYFPALAKLTGSPKAALLLGHAIFITRDVVKNSPSQNGWFARTADHWQRHTGLTIREQATARDTLKSLGIIEEARTGMPARLWSRVNLDVLCQRLNSTVQGAMAIGWSWEEAAMRTLLGRPIAFYAPLAHGTGSAISGLVLSQLISEVRQGQGQFDEAPMHAKPLNYWAALGLGEYQVKHAKRELIENNLISIKREKVIHGRALISVNLSAITNMARKKFNEINAPASMWETSNQECGNPTFFLGGKRKSRIAETTQVLGMKAQINSGGKRKSRNAETTQDYKEGVKKSLKLLQTDSETLQVDVSNLGFAVVVFKEKAVSKPSTPSDLVFPRFMLSDEQKSATQILKQSNRPQVLLDELAGKYDLQPGSIRSPLGFLATLNKLDKAGQFNPSYAARVEKRRTPETAQVPVAVFTDADRQTAKLKMAQVMSQFNVRKSTS